MKRFVLPALIITLAVTTAMFAQPAPGRGFGPPMAPRHQAILDKLNLTDAQQSQMRKLRLDLMKKQTTLRSKIHTLRLEIQEHFLADKVDRAAIEKNIKAISDAQQQMKLNMLAHWFDVNGILTTEQQKIWKDAAADMGARMREGMRQRLRKMMREHWWDNPEDDD